MSLRVESFKACTPKSISSLDGSKRLVCKFTMDFPFLF